MLSDQRFFKYNQIHFFLSMKTLQFFRQVGLLESPVTVTRRTGILQILALDFAPFFYILEP